METPREALEVLASARGQRCSETDHVSTRPEAHQWTVTYWSRLIREVVLWRGHDLLSQAQYLFDAGHVLGSRILIRAALETVSTLVHLDHLIMQVVRGSLGFSEFTDIVRQRLLGGRDKHTKYEALNIVGAIRAWDSAMPGVLRMYDTLSESAHPNFEGQLFGYSRIDYERDETLFGNHWADMWSDRHDSLVVFVAGYLYREYSEVWPERAKQLNEWIVANPTKVLQSLGDNDSATASGPCS